MRALSDTESVAGLLEEVAHARSRLSGISAVAAGDPHLAPEVWRTAYTELSATLEELQVAYEQLVVREERATASGHALDLRSADVEAIFHGVPVPYVVLSGRKVLLRANRLAEGLLGLTERRLVGKPFPVFVDVAARPQARALLDRAGESDEPVVWRSVLLPRGGAPLVAELRASRLRDSSALPLLGLVVLPVEGVTAPP